MTTGLKTVPIRRHRKGKAFEDSDSVAREEPLEIRLDGQALSVTMRTPGEDLDLAVGFLFTEGILPEVQPRRRRSVAFRKKGVSEGDASSSPLPAPQYLFKKGGRNVVDVFLPAAKAAGARRRLQTRFFVSSSCGLCGRTSVSQTRRRLGAIKTDGCFNVAKLRELPAKMRSSQATFEFTGGLHGAALFSSDGKLLVVREDVGRHNAVDKAIGKWIRSPEANWKPFGLLVSGRASFEIVQKALAAKLPLVVAVSAPSSLAVELAQESGITLVAFLREEGFNIYSRPDRIK